MGYIEEIRSLVGHRPINLTGSIVIIKNKDGKILLQERDYPEGVWSFPGGMAELGESCEETAIREVKEETNLLVKNLKLFGVYSGKNYKCRAKNGDEWYVTVIAYMTEDYSGELKINDSESKQLVWLGKDELPEHFGKSQKQILLDYVKKYM